MDDLERLELLTDAIDRLRELSVDRYIMVEGNKDVAAMGRLGISGDFLEVQVMGGPMKAAEKAWRDGRKAVILTDWDRRGNDLAVRLRESMDSLCVEYDDTIRADIARACRCFSKDVESMDSAFDILTERAGMD